jgi:xanthine dehydrogenase accessory factor
MNSIHHKILEQIRSGSGIVIATVIQTSGSTPQKPGSSALFGEEGLVAGTVGGGLLEKEVSHISESVLISGVSDHYYFDLDSDLDPEGAICGGEAMVLVDAEPFRHLAVFEEMENTLKSQGEGFLLTTISLKNDTGRKIKRYWIKGTSEADMPAGMEPALKKLIREHLNRALKYGFARITLKTDPSHQLEMALLEHIHPKPHLVIAGAGHIGSALAHLGSFLEFKVTVVDDRPEFANDKLIPDADHIVVATIGPAMKRLVKGKNTYVVIVTHGHHQDGEALRACIGSEAAYIGMIGSKHKVGVLKKQFLEEKWATPEQWSAIHAPIGLDIGSITVQEIATSIAAQLVQARNDKKDPHAT